MKILENYDLKSLSYLKIGGVARYFVEIEKIEEWQKIIEIRDKERLPIIMVGEGSNTVFNDGFHNKIFVKIGSDEILKVYEDRDGVNINVAGGTNWDKLVEWAVKHKFSGLELLSGIPGTVGAAPVQNISAYGGSLFDTLTHIKVFDLKTEELYELNNQECEFGYRNSLVKKNPGRFAIISVSFRLSKDKPALPRYKDLALYFLKKRNKTPTIREIRQAVLDVRKEKLPDPRTEPNCGSFFLNPIVDIETAKSLAKKFGDMPQFPISLGEIKLSGGWLIEKSGFKGKDFGNLKVSPKNALIIIGNGRATFEDLVSLKKRIIDGVEKNFHVRLAPEVGFVE
ncbi:MAG TPA: UDP-N-acetylmuramate dehydrogenase [Candidatus Paceibacterota bacterium]|nr:UDP-N-acetylmuramate dehydrogenase [Candidatus Paceibacterota bacterium]HRZ34711.1 UDP-N-acetylmuramate dehydrogenase [Candidatus Paceibacterota bacterium]